MAPYRPTRRWMGRATRVRLYTRRVDIRRDNPVGRAPDTRMTRRQVLRLTPQGWSLGRHHGRWTPADLDQVLAQLDTAHAMHLTGAVTPADARTLAELVHR